MDAPVQREPRPTDRRFGERRPADRPGGRPLGPLLEVRSYDRPVVVRIVGGVVLSAVLSVGVVANRLEPPPAGFGAHQQLGLGACPLPVVLGVPCPTCGMTTAVAHFAGGHPWQSFLAQPAGFCVALGLLIVGILAGEAVVAGRFRGINWYRVSPVRVAAGGVFLVLAAWAYKLVMMRWVG